MNESKVDAERLAALLDGRLSAREREAIMAELASSDAAYDALVDAMTASPSSGDAHVSADAGAGRAHPRDTRRSWGGAGGRWLALAAALVVLAALPWLWSVRHRSASNTPVQFAALLAGQTAALPNTWDSRPWTTTRGAGEPLTAESRATRIGAHLVDLEMAVRTRDARTGPLAAEIAVLLEGIPGGSMAAAIYRDAGRRTDAPRDSLAGLLERGRVAAMELSDTQAVTLGGWLEAARLAAAGHDVSFFHNSASRDMLARAAGRPGLARDARGTVDRVRAAVAADSPDWSLLEGDLTTLLASLGS